MPKRTLSIHSVEERSDGFAPKRGLFRRLTMSSRKLFGGAFAPSPAAAEPMTQRTSIVQKAMQARRMSVQAAVDEISVTFAQKTAIDISGLPQLPTRPSGPNPEALPAFHVVEPAKGKTHTATLILLHGFTCSGSQLAHELMPGLKQRLYPSAYQHMRFVFLTAPRRRVSCYENPNQEENAWHDYFTDHGGAEGRPDVEEEIDVGQLNWTRDQVHKVIDAEAALLGGDYKKVGILGQSQGSCTALHCTLTHSQCVAGILCSIGQLYSHTPVPKDRADELQIFTFNGAADDCIACCLSLRTYARLLEAGYQVRMHVQPGTGHEGCSDPELDLLCEALESWGLIKSGLIR